jgi:undecaprenyl-phosphate galactose phosphotransferase
MTTIGGKSPVLKVRLAGTPQRPGFFGKIYIGYPKRGLDLLLCTLSMISIVPVLVVVATIVAIDGGWPFYGHERIGQHGRRFKCLKFRTMRKDSAAALENLLARDPAAAAEWATSHKLTNDPRITRMGKWLRRTSLDELPQLINVLRGEMSLVGPRPVTEDELAKYAEHLPKYLALRPGLTGVWQVHGRGLVGYPERVEMDAHYFLTASFFGDLRLMLLTSQVVLKRRGQ